MQETLLYAMIILYSAAFLLYSLHAAVWKRSFVFWGARLLFAGGIGAHLFKMIHRAVESGRAPWGNQFEVMILFAFVIAAFYLVFEITSKNRVVAPFASLIVALTCAFAASFLDPTVTQLVPALDSPWLAIHVSVTVISYGAFTISFLAAFQYLLKQPRARHRYLATLAASTCIGFVTLILVMHKQDILKPYTESLGAFLLLLLYCVGAGAAISLPLYGFFSLIKVGRFFADEAALEKWTYRWISLGFPLLALGIMMGAWWAAEAWGSYWSNDAKEWWALITWLIYAIYLHMHLIAKWRGPKSAWLSVIGFISMIFTFFGVNYLLVGLHSYA